MRLWTTLAIVVLNTVLVWRAPTIGSAVALFTTSQSMLLILTVVTLMCCPYRRSDRWNIVASLCTLVLTTLSALANFLVVLVALGISGAESALKGAATTMLVLLALAFVVTFIAFLFTHALGVCKLCGCNCDHCESPTPQQGAAGDEANGIEMNPLFIASAAKATAAETATAAVVAAAGGGGAAVGAAAGAADAPGPGAPLPLGWIAYADENTSVPYYHNSVTGATSWTRPAAVKEGAAVLPVAKKKEPPPPRAESSAVNELVRWKKKKRPGASFAETLFKVDPVDGGDGDGAGTIPSHLASLFHKIFTIADSNGDGELSTMELIRMLRTRAKGSPLDGNAHAMFTLRTQLQKAGGGDDDEDAEIGAESFAQGMMDVVSSTPEGLSLLLRYTRTRTHIRTELTLSPPPLFRRSCSAVDTLRAQG